jgi:hypothetical protein
MIWSVEASVLGEVPGPVFAACKLSFSPALEGAAQNTHRLTQLFRDEGHQRRPQLCRRLKPKMQMFAIVSRWLSDPDVECGQWWSLHPLSQSFDKPVYEEGDRWILGAEPIPCGKKRGQSDRQQRVQGRTESFCRRSRIKKPLLGANGQPITFLGPYLNAIRQMIRGNFAKGRVP